MDKLPAYSPVFSEHATDFIALLPRRQQRKIRSLIHQLVASPFVPSDYTIRDQSGRGIEYLLSEEFVFAYWIDHGAREIRFTEIACVE